MTLWTISTFWWRRKRALAALRLPVANRPRKAPPPATPFTRLLRRQPPDTVALWQETQGLILRDAGVLVLDDTTLDKPYALIAGIPVWKTAKRYGLMGGYG